VRLVAATNRDLDAMVREKTFREDLFFRLNVVRIKMPPLRERTEDIPLLLDSFIRAYTKENNLPEVTVDAAAMRTLQSYSWPGNIRELRNFAENIVVMRRGGIVGQAELDPKFFAAIPGPIGACGGGASSPGAPSLSVEENEKRLLRQALIEARGNRTKAAKLMGISRRTLHRKIHQWPELDVKEHG
jgi:DNA-binding NtrC family response regulator